jgi:putative spermidine/putrescine transport system ATP-binding protein
VAGFIGENNKLEGVVESITGSHALVRLAGGVLIDATAVNVSAVGQPTMVSIRPERVEVLALNAVEKAGLGHTVEAEVLEFIYMGDVFRVRLSVAGSDNFIVKYRNARGRRWLKPGEKIRIGWAREDARALDP